MKKALGASSMNLSGVNPLPSVETGSTGQPNRVPAPNSSRRKATISRISE